MTTVRFKLTAPYRHHAAGETIEIPIHRSWYPRLYGLEGEVVAEIADVANVQTIPEPASTPTPTRRRHQSETPPTSDGPIETE